MPPAGATIRRQLTVDRVAAVFAVATLAVAWIAGSMLAQRDDERLIRRALPEADRLEPRGTGAYAAYRSGDLVGFIATGDARGYGGPIRVAVGVSPQGVVVGTAVMAHAETPSFFKRVASRGYLGQLVDKRYDEAFEIGSDLHAITGATVTSRALAEAVRAASRQVAGEHLRLPVEPPLSPPVRFGAPEVAVLLLFAAGFAERRFRTKHRSTLRWATLLSGLLVLGFWYNTPLTISKVSALLIGYWPAWQSNLYWYFLIGGILLVATVSGKNAYCAGFCPFGAAQECLGAIGGARLTVGHRVRRNLMWLQRGLAWAALVLALLFRNPGVSSYEVFGTLFSFTGTAAAFFVLAVVLMLSMFVRRPWCRFLCPLNPLYDLVRMLRERIIALWNSPRTGGAPLSI